MKPGKIAAQAAHASMKVFFDNIVISKDYVFPEKKVGIIELTPEMESWLSGIFTKIALAVNSEEELLAIYEKAKEQNIPCSLIQDCGKTVFNNVPTYTCVGIGPDTSERIDVVTGHLKLF